MNIKYFTLIIAFLLGLSACGSSPTYQGNSLTNEQNNQIKHSPAELLQQAKAASKNGQVEVYKKLLFQSAAMGYPEAQYQLGLTILHSPSFPDYKAEAMKWLAKAANQNHKKAQFNLAIGYMTGMGVEKSPSIMLEWLNKSINNGYPKAYYILGSLYLQGAAGVERDEEKGYSLVKKAAEMGYEDAIRFFSDGFPVEQLEKTQNISTYGAGVFIFKAPQDLKNENIVAVKDKSAFAVYKTNSAPEYLFLIAGKFQFNASTTKEYISKLYETLYSNSSLELISQRQSGENGTRFILKEKSSPHSLTYRHVDIQPGKNTLYLSQLQTNDVNAPEWFGIKLCNDAMCDNLDQKAIEIPSDLQ